MLRLLVLLLLLILGFASESESASRGTSELFPPCIGGITSFCFICCYSWMLRCIWSRFHHGSPWMGSSAPCASLTSEDVGCKSCFFSPNYEQACVEPEQCAYDITGKILKGFPREDIGISSITEDENLTAQELGATLNEVLHISGSNECLDHNSNLSLNQDEICNDTEMQSLSVSTNMLEGSSKREMMLLSESEMLQSHPLEIEVREELSSTAVHIESSSNPTTPKLVSAMKGSMQSGLLPKTKLSVKWAPDVYDPPPRSESHTVKGYRHHSKSIKRDYYKHKHTKSKSSRRSGGDSKHAYRKSASNSIDPRILRLQALHERSIRTDCGELNVEVPDHAVKGQDMKCKGNFYMESLSPARLSVAKTLSGSFRL